MATFRHLIANSTFIMPKGKVLVFAGAIGHPGIYSTQDEEEIAELRKLSVLPSVQIDELKEVPADDDATKTVVDADAATKPLDPSIAAAVQDAAASAEKAADPTLTATAADLGKLIAAAKNS